MPDGAAIFDNVLSGGNMGKRDFMTGRNLLPHLDGRTSAGDTFSFFQRLQSHGHIVRRMNDNIFQHKEIL